MSCLDSEVVPDAAYHIAVVAPACPLDVYNSYGSWITADRCVLLSHKQVSNSLLLPSVTKMKTWKESLVFANHNKLVFLVHFRTHPLQSNPNKTKFSSTNFFFFSVWAPITRSYDFVLASSIQSQSLKIFIRLKVTLSLPFRYSRRLASSNSCVWVSPLCVFYQFNE